MPVSRKQKKPPAPKRQDHQIVFERLSFGGADEHPQFKEAMLASVRTEVAAFPDQLEALLSVLRERMPDAILATFAFYGSQATIALDGSTRSFSKDILQHHIELLQVRIPMMPPVYSEMIPPVVPR